MKRKGLLFLFLACFIAIGCANGAVRSVKRNTYNNSNVVTTSRARTATNTSQNKNISNRLNTGRSAVTSTNTRKIKQNVSNRSVNSYQPTKNVIGRVATTSTIQKFDQEYETCRDAYFTCMDQFCASVDDTYRRCICSSRLSEIKQKQSALSQSADSLNTFHDINLDIINKSAAEVKAMTSATIGEQVASSKVDKSDSAQQLNAISQVLSKTKSKSLSTSGTLDAGGDIKSIWATTDLASGANIANLTGEPLFNAVNAQCAEMVTDQCSSSILNMVISAYGMYIENDCSALANDLSKKKNTANASIRETKREMQVARLDNYDAHNSLSINDCINSIRNDVTADTACGKNFVHCLDVTGLYLNIDTGEPIYTPSFYNLANQISLSGNILNNQTNRMVVNILNKKRAFAEKSLDKCRDLSGDIWNEFMRQSIIEIHQQQQEKIRNVKTECLGVVNQCYDSQTNSLKDFSSVKDKTLLGMTLETVEDLCREKLDTCSNLYGGGPDGLTALVNAMHDIVDQRIVAECQNFLADFAQNLCTVQSTDSIHSYPYTCRVYTPGDQLYATIPECNTASGHNSSCGDYTDSLYQRFVHYAMQVCIRPSEYEKLNDTVPNIVLQDINIIMDKMRISMGQELSKECERLGGIWITSPYPENSAVQLHEQFYTETGANKQWGYCKTPIATSETYVITFNDNYDNDDTTSTSAVLTSVVTYGETMPSVSVPTRTATTASDNTQTYHCFTGYFTQPDGAGVQYYDKDGDPTRTWDIASNTTLYANFDDSIVECSNTAYVELISISGH